MFADELIGALAMAIIYRYAKSLPRGVAREICTHGGESKDANVSKVLHDFHP
jgi:hypothetical protein